MNPALTPEQNAESARRLEVLASKLDTVPDVRFNYRRWVGSDWRGKLDLSCGTTACALGWATTIPEFVALGLRLGCDAEGEGYVHMEGEAPDTDTPFVAAREVFLLTGGEADFLFTPGEYLDGDLSPNGYATASDVADHIRSFIAKHRDPAHDWKDWGGGDDPRVLLDSVVTGKLVRAKLAEERR